MMIIKILKACYTIKWYILSVVCLFILARLQSCYISGTYIYVFLLNIPAILIPYLVLWKLDALRYYNRALANESLQKYNAALSDYANAIELNPKNADYFAQRAILKSKLQGYQGSALSDIDKAISLEPTHAGYKQIRTEIARITTGSRPVNQQQEFVPKEQSFATNQTSSPLVNTNLSSTSTVAHSDYETLARENMQKQNYGLAIDYFGRAIDDKPFSSQNAELYYLRGECYKNLGNIRAARKDYDQAILLNENIKTKRNYLRN